LWGGTEGAVHTVKTIEARKHQENGKERNKKPLVVCDKVIKNKDEEGVENSADELEDDFSNSIPDRVKPGSISSRKGGKVLRTEGTFLFTKTLRSKTGALLIQAPELIGREVRTRRCRVHL